MVVALKNLQLSENGNNEKQLRRKTRHCRSFSTVLVSFTLNTICTDEMLSHFKEYFKGPANKSEAAVQT